MAILQLHFVASYMSDELVAGFTTGAAFHVAASQLPKLFGLKIPSHQGLFKLFYVLRDVILSLPKMNIADLVTSVICIAFLHIGKWYINPIVRRRISIPVPFELIAVCSCRTRYFETIPEEFSKQDFTLHSVKLTIF
ncbi:unnamed protein product [Anisakis simplex]|uniref:Putative sulfate transporter (inferred by orthology to a S. mansoni protein) n=1 Tax=Anisakis simplex TaxID=6269 RepID=A0A0M3J8U6_ANISI|nr:unnamed protein product [Anisakis simplex]